MKNKRYDAIAKQVEAGKEYPLLDAIKLAKKTATAKFKETINVTIVLGIDTKQTDQMVRGSLMLPFNTGKVPRIIVFAKGEKEKEAQTAGADQVGFADLIAKVKSGWMDFDIAIATPDSMKDVGTLGKVLGPSGLMPNPKSGTVTFDLARVIGEFKKGKLEYRADAGGVIRVVIGRSNMVEDELYKNANALIEAVTLSKPVGLKGQYLRKIVISATMGPGCKVDRQPYIKMAAV